METLRPSYQFKTEAIRRGPVKDGVLLGNLSLKGYGDPTTMQGDFAALPRRSRLRAFIG